MMTHDWHRLVIQTVAGFIHVAFLLWYFVLFHSIFLDYHNLYLPSNGKHILFWAHWKQSPKWVSNLLTYVFFLEPRHSYVKQMSSISCRLFPLFVWCRLHLVLDGCWTRTMKVPNQRFQVVKLKSSLRKLNGRHHHGYVTFVVMTIPSPFMTYHWIFNTNNTTAVSSKAGTDYPSRTTEFKHVFSRVPISH